MAFDIASRLIKVKGGAQYLQVRDRLQWMIDDCKEREVEYEIKTEMVHLDTDMKLAVHRAEVYVPGVGRATGYGSETERDFPPGWIEKAETKAVGRALAALGYGTSAALDWDDSERYADTPVEPRRDTTVTRETPRETSPARPMHVVKNTGVAAGGKGVTGKAPADPAEEAEARHKGLVRVGFAAGGHPQPKGWPDIVQIGHAHYGMEELSEEQLRDDELRRQWLAILVDKLDLPPQADDQPQEEDQEAARLVAQYRERIATATTQSAVNAIMQEARKGAGLDKPDIAKLVEATNARLTALRRSS